MLLIFRCVTWHFCCSGFLWKVQGQNCKLQFLDSLWQFQVQFTSWHAIPLGEVSRFPVQVGRAMNQDLDFTSADYGFYATLGFTVPLRGANLKLPHGSPKKHRFRKNVYCKRTVKIHFKPYIMVLSIHFYGIFKDYSDYNHCFSINFYGFSLHLRAVTWPISGSPWPPCGRAWPQIAWTASSSRPWRVSAGAVAQHIVACAKFQIIMNLHNIYIYIYVCVLYLTYIYIYI